jgi:hypothetical protein
MGWIVFDSDGRSWDGCSRSLSDSLGTSLQGQILINYCVVNLGFVALKDAGASAQIRLRPKLVSVDALLGLRAHLRTCKCERLLVSVLEESWHHRVVRSPEELLALLPHRGARSG